MATLIAVVVSFGGLAEIVPLMYQAEAIKPSPGVEPYPALELAGRDVYVREGCYNCHSQMVRTLQFETARYGTYSSTPASRCTTARSSGEASAPGRISPASAAGIRMTGTGCTWTTRAKWCRNPTCRDSRGWRRTSWMARTVQRHMRGLHALGDPYSEADIAGAPKAVEGRRNRMPWWPTCRDWAATRRRESDMVSGIITAVLMLLFIGGSIWVWRPERKAEFEAAASCRWHEDEEVKS